MFAPGHLGELTRIIPFEMVDAVLAETGAVQQRLRKIPARVVVYLLLAAALFEDCGYLAVWRRLTAALETIPVVKITGAGLWDARRRLGVRPMRALFDLLRGPATVIRTRGARFKGLLAVAIDGTYLDVPDSPPHRARLGKGSNRFGTAGYPQICLTALVACGTRAILDAAFGPRSQGETGHGRRLMRSLHAGMIVLLDRGFSGNAFLTAVAATEASFLARITATRKPPVLARFGDGSHLSRFGALEVRIIECEITVTTSQGRRTGLYRLATNLLDHHRYPASDLVSLYHERWEVESAYFAIKKTMLGRRVLRSTTPPGIAQEVYALLSAYQALRIAIADATGATPGTDPDRASFSVALRCARDQIVQAAGIIAGTTIDLVGTIGRTVLEHLMPARRLRISPRAVKRPLSRYAYKSLNIDRRTYTATLSINILTPTISP
ncbi:IS4 family transposase [Streptomyces phaeolivaceus]|uniref:IS4 family transposase n=1 Tax=Streptomyces phaeolivaceus TaxID=2653200 RepID=UPI00186A249E|nr:IS4 family transposase [Streptomyces phaeolivaceus]